MEELIITNFTIFEDYNNPTFDVQLNMDYTINILVSIISKLKNLKLLIIQQDVDCAYKDFENTFKKRITELSLQNTQPTDSKLKIYFTVFDNGSTFLDNHLAFKYDYCKCFCDVNYCSNKNGCECTLYPYSEKARKLNEEKMKRYKCEN